MASNTEALALVDAQIARLRGLGSLAGEVAPLVAAELRRELDANISAGVGPDGKAWQLTAKGEVPLRNAGANLVVTAIGSIVVARLTGHVARHHLGSARGGIARPILPSRRELGPLVKATRALVATRFAARMQGGT